MGKLKDLTSVRVFGKTRINTIRARKFGRVSLAEKPINPLPGMNQPETRVALALQALKIGYTSQTSFLGGSILGGARADFVLPAFKIVMNYDGPFHGTTEGTARDILVDQTYIMQGYKVIKIREYDLVDLKNRLLQYIGVKIDPQEVKA